MISLCLIFILFRINSIDSSLASCRQKFGSNQYDLNQLDHLTILGEASSFRYVLTPCGLVPTELCGKNTGTFEDGMTACQERISGAIFESAMGFLDGYQKLPNLEFKENPQGSGTGILMTMRNAVCNGRERLVKVIFICDKKVDEPTKMDVIEDPTCQFTISIKAAAACPLESGLTGGAIFIIIFFVLIIVYIISGVLFNRFKQKATGLAILPHLDFWHTVIQLFLDGCKFTWDFIRGFSRQISMPSKAYESL